LNVSYTVGNKYFYVFLSVFFFSIVLPFSFYSLLSYHRVTSCLCVQVTTACKKHGGFYLGSIGGPAAILAQNCIKRVEVLEYPELGQWDEFCLYIISKCFFYQHMHAAHVVVIAMAWAFICLSVHPSVCSSYPAALSKWCRLGSQTFYCGLPWKFNLLQQNFVPMGAGVLLKRGRQIGVPLPPSKKTFFCHYWLVYCENGCR